MNKGQRLFLQGHVRMAGMRLFGCTLVICFASTWAAAQPVASSDHAVLSETVERQAVVRQGLSLQHGYHSAYNRTTFAYETSTLWDAPLPSHWGSMALHIEWGVSYWKADRREPDTMWQASAIPMLRWWPSDGFYIEAGVGPTILSRKRFAGRDISTHLQFGSHAGAGVVIGGAHRLGIRYAHFSNAGIKKPNPGLDVIGLVYTWQF